MSTIRGRAVQVGGMQVDAGAAGRVGDNLQTRPAFRWSSGQFQPLPALGIGMDHPLLDLNSVASWRLLAVAAAVAYIVGFHVMLGSVRVGIGPGR